MADLPPDSAADIARAWDVVDDIEHTRDLFAERIDVERLLKAAGFEAANHRWVWLWTFEERNLVFTIHKDGIVVPITDARWLVGRIREYGLLPRRPDVVQD